MRKYGIVGLHLCIPNATFTIKFFDISSHGELHWRYIACIFCSCCQTFERRRLFCSLRWGCRIRNYFVFSDCKAFCNRSVRNQAGSKWKVIDTRGLKVSLE